MLLSEYEKILKSKEKNKPLKEPGDYIEGIVDDFFKTSKKTPEKKEQPEKIKGVLFMNGFFSLLFEENNENKGSERNKINYENCRLNAKNKVDIPLKNIVNKNLDAFLEYESAKKLKENVSNISQLSENNFDELLILFKVDELFKKNSGKIEIDDITMIYNGGSNITLAVKVPEHVLFDHKSGGGYYHFPQTNVSVDITSTDMKNFSHGAVKLHNLNNEMIQSPFIEEGKNYGKSNICMGYYSTDFFGRMDFFNAIAKYLSDARKVILEGYTYSCGPHRRLSNEAFFGNKISEKEIEARKLKVTNMKK